MTMKRTYDPETGEIGRFVSDEYIVRSPKQREAGRKWYDRQENRGRLPDFTFSDMERIKEIIDRIEDKHLGYLLFLQTYIDPKTNILVFGRLQLPMTRANIREVMRLGDTSFRAFFKAMTENSLIIEDSDTGFFSISSPYHFRGKANGRKVVKNYITNTRQLYSERKATELGYLYRLLPYIHLKDNIICHNPFEVNPANIQAMTAGELSKVLNVSERSVPRIIKKMTMDGMYVFAEMKRGTAKFYLVNPCICNRGDYPDHTLLTLFLCKTK